MPGLTALLPLALVLGLCFGSFVAATAYRLPRGATLLGRSHCPSCGATLGAADLVPVLSWLALGRRCRHCHAPVSGRYALVEMLTALLWVGAMLLVPDPVAALSVALLGTVLLIAGLIDLEHLYLPDSLMASAALLVLLPWSAGLADPVRGLQGAALFGGLALLVRAVASWRAGREAMGLGDVKLMAVAGLWLGPWLLAPFLALGGLGGVALALLHRGPTSRQEVPFGPSLTAALLFLLVMDMRRWAPLALLTGQV